jgi:hypothetical protein
VGGIKVETDAEEYVKLGVFSTTKNESVTFN